MQDWAASFRAAGLLRDGQAVRVVVFLVSSCLDVFRVFSPVGCSSQKLTAGLLATAALRRRLHKRVCKLFYGNDSQQLQFDCTLYFLKQLERRTQSAVWRTACDVFLKKWGRRKSIPMSETCPHRDGHKHRDTLAQTLSWPSGWTTRWLFLTCV